MNKCHDRDYFFKYVTADVAKKILETLQVRCSSPILFNDPFDSQIEIQHDIQNGEELVKRATYKICEILHPMLTSRSIEGNHNLVFSEILKDGKFVSDRTEAFDRFYVEINEKIIEFAKEDRIFCVSEKEDNLLMWSHYADEHKGAVIKLRCIPGKNAALCAAKPVIYSDKVPLLTIEDFFNGEQAIKEYILNVALLTKSRDWEYEREWRVILLRQQYGQDYDLRGIFEEELDSIYLGCQMKEEDKKDILDIVNAKRRNMKVFEARKNQREFKLNFNRK